MQHRQVLITGGSGGLGMAVVRKLFTGDTQMVLSYHSETGLDSFRAKLSAEMNEKIRFIKTDLSREEEVRQLIDQLPDLQILVHLVGGFTMAPTVDFTLQNFQQQLNINLITAFLTCKYSLRQMVKNNYGRIVTIGSRAAVEPSAALAAYAAAKAGVVALTRAIAAETRGTNITANVILPGVIDTPANREAMGEQNTQQWVKPESIAALIYLLTSAEARNIRGAVIPVYGDL
jgi:NAD(P)-dependent dehydrogenase (short-subunit alcohol dehydrogenase family)